jgi:hypothetical protein
MNRRELLCALAAGGVMTAAGLWMPGQKLISIPKTSWEADFRRALAPWQKDLLRQLDHAIANSYRLSIASYRRRQYPVAAQRPWSA